MHVSQLAAVNHVTVLAGDGAAVLAWMLLRACFHYACGQAEVAGSAITQRSRNATQLCTLRLDSDPLDTLSNPPSQRAVSLSSFYFEIC